MKTNHYISTTTAAGVLILIAGAGVVFTPGAAAQDNGAQNNGSGEAAKIAIGIAIAPVKLDLSGKDPNLVGFGSYLVNAATGCAQCHSAGPQTEYAPGGNPFLRQHPAKLNPATYLGGGDDFGAFPDPSGPFPHIVSRNLTPDSTGLPMGGMSYGQFVEVMRTGVDRDLVHPNCQDPPNGKCLPGPFDGSLLQIMPWPFFQNLTDHDLQAIYEYLRAVPCLEGGPNEPANRCSASAAKTSAVAGPKNATVVLREFPLDATKSTSADGKPLLYQWSISPGYPSAGISGGNSAAPVVQFGTSRGVYSFQLTVTDSSGKSAMDVVTVNYQGN